MSAPQITVATVATVAEQKLGRHFAISFSRRTLCFRVFHINKRGERFAHPYASKQSARYIQKVLDKWAFSPHISSRENNELERFVQFPPKGYAVLAYPLKAFEERAATE